MIIQTGEMSDFAYSSLAVALITDGED